MGMQKYRGGFTIIEVMLFLAVSGALAIGILGSSAIGINNQRYVDAVNSFKALIQEEFTNTTQVINSRQDGSACSDPSNTRPVGATECIIMGRLMAVGSAGEITRSNLIGFSSASEPAASNDIDDIKAYNPTIDQASQITSTMNWGTHLKDAQAISIVIFNAPSSGNVLAFVHAGSVINTQAQLKNFIDNGTNDFTNTERRTICIEPAGLTIAQIQAVQIAAYAAGPSAVEQVAGADACA